MNNISVVVLVGMLVFSVISISLLIHAERKLQIRWLLEKMNAKEISIGWMPAPDRWFSYYMVEYEDSAGMKHTRACRVDGISNAAQWDEPEK